MSHCIMLNTKKPSSLIQDRILQCNHVIVWKDIKKNVRFSRSERFQKENIGVSFKHLEKQLQLSTLIGGFKWLLRVVWLGLKRDMIHSV